MWPKPSKGTTGKHGRTDSLAEAQRTEATTCKHIWTRAARVAGGVGAEKQLKLKRNDATARNAGGKIAREPLLLSFALQRPNA